MRRVKELIDVWFDSGAMPVAQWHYPFENVEEFKRQFPRISSAKLLTDPGLVLFPLGCQRWFLTVSAIRT